jgi:hypothetical protein
MQYCFAIQLANKVGKFCLLEIVHCQLNLADSPDMQATGVAAAVQQGCKVAFEKKN